MGWDIGMHGADDNEVIGAGGDIWKEIADFEAALSVFREAKGGAKRGAGSSFRFEVFHGKGFSMEAGEFWLWIESVHVSRSAIGEEVDEVFGFPRKVGGAGGKGGSFSQSDVSLGICDACEAQHSKPHAAALQEVASAG